MFKFQNCYEIKSHIIYCNLWVTLIRYNRLRKMNQKNVLLFMVKGTKPMVSHDIFYRVVVISLWYYIIRFSKFKGYFQRLKSFVVLIYK